MADPVPEPNNENEPAAAPDAPPTDLRDLVQTYGRPLLLGTALAAAIVVGTGYFRGQKRQAAEDAARMLSSGRPEQLEALVAQHAKTPSAPIALLALARLDFHSGRYEAAEKRYAGFMANHADHPFREVAEINRAQCVEALGRTDEAMKAFDAVLAKGGQGLYVTGAKIGRARCFEQLGRYDEARHAYEEIVAADADGPWVGPAESALRTIDRKRRAAKTTVAIGLPPPAPAPAPKP